MFCPGCGLEDTQSNQYCRSCGTDLASVNTVMENPGARAATGASSRDQIHTAIAERVKNAKSASELSKFTEEVLPKIEKFLEGPEERRLRRIRRGTIVSLIGLGAAIAFAIASNAGADEELIILAAFGLVAFFIGLAMTVNGWFFTVPKSSLGQEETVTNDFQQAIEGSNSNPNTNELLMPPSAQQEFTSVTENTTRHLKEKKPVSR